MTVTETVKKHVKDNPGCLAAHAAKALDLEVKVVSKALKALADTGAVIGEGKTRGRKYRVA